MPRKFKKVELNIFDQQIIEFRHPGIQAAIQASSHIYIHPWSSEEAEELMEEVEEVEEWATQHQYMIAVWMHIRSRWL